MSDASRQRLLDLLADRALDGLSPREAAEAAALSRRYPDIDVSELDRLAACLTDVPAVPMPAALAGRILADAPAHLPRKRRPLAWGGWLAAACLAAVLVGAWWSSRPPSTQSALGRLLAEADAVRLEADGGDIVWSNAKQEGFLLLRLPANDPRESQYQLWIFDAGRDERFPVHGGVFDVSGPGEVVPIRATLPVGRPVLFAVTREAPGGVVVSDRQRIVMAAKVP